VYNVVPGDIMMNPRRQSRARYPDDIKIGANDERRRPEDDAFAYFHDARTAY
jgi:hypothetical protein